MLHVTSLKGKVNVKQIKSTLRDMSSGGDALLKAYDKTMEILQSQEEGTRALAMSTLSWVAFSPRILTLEMLQHALAIEMGNEALDFDNVTDSEIILSNCAGLLTLHQVSFRDETKVEVRLVHETTQAYFNSTKMRWFGDVDLRLAQLCLTYSSFSVFGSGACTTWTALDAVNLRYPLLRYIGNHLGDYTGVQRSDCRYLLEKFYLSQPHVQLCLQTRRADALKHHGMLDGNFPSSPEQYQQSNGLRLAFEHRIFHVVPHLLRLGLDPNVDDDYVLIQRAIRKDPLLECVPILVSTPGVNCNVEDADGKTPLIYACESGYLEKVQLLLGLDLGASPSLSVISPHHAIIRIDPPVSKADINYRNRFGRTALHYTCAGNDDSVYILKALLSVDRIDCLTPDKEGKLPLHWAVQSGNLKIARLLLSQPGVVLGLRSRDRQGRTPLSFAVERNHLLMARALIRLSEAHEITPGLVEQTFSQHAGKDKYSGNLIDEILSKLQMDGSPFIADCGPSLVLTAARSIPSAELHLETALSIPEISINLPDNEGRTPLWHCIDGKSPRLCHLLLKKDDIDVNACDDYGSSAFHLVARWGNADVMESLLGKPAANFYTPDYLGTPLLHATYGDHPEIVELLLNKYNATDRKFAVDTTVAYKSPPTVAKSAKRVQRWLASDMPTSTALSTEDESVSMGCLLAIAAMNTMPYCFKLLESHFKAWSSMPRIWRRKCLLVATETAGDATFDYIMKLVRHTECKDTRTTGIIRLGRQSWDEIDIYDIAALATAQELNLWDIDGQTAIHAAVNRKDMRTVRICMALGGDTMVKNSAGLVAEDRMQEVLEECMQESPEMEELYDMYNFVYHCHVKERLARKYS
jgi:ankyrin repeat protein